MSPTSSEVSSSGKTYVSIENLAEKYFLTEWQPTNSRSRFRCEPVVIVKRTKERTQQFIFISSKLMLLSYSLPTSIAAVVLIFAEKANV